MTLTTLDAVTHAWLALDLGLAVYAVLRLRWHARVGLLAGALFGVLPLLWLIRLDLFATMRFTAWLVFLYVPLYLLFVAVRRPPTPEGQEPTTLQRAGRLGAGITALLIVVVGVDAFLIEPWRLEVTTHRIQSDKVDEPLLIAVLADMQTDAPAGWERHVLRLAMAEEPDLILFPGDYVQHPSASTNRELRKALRAIFVEEGLSAPLGVVAVQGNVDYPQWPEIFDGLPVIAEPRTTVHQAGPVSVSALSFTDGFNDRLAVSDQPGLHIAMAHAPDFALGDIDADILVAGHTHGGQVRLPLLGPLITFSAVPKPWAAGRTELESGATLIVSRGIGMERAFAPRLRFFCPPELVFIEVVPSD